ncbi:MAG: cobyrinate a,c-diamide synthase, partial [Xanthobacteraceae bacterium]|nr:cobyrinate a,c-diamide synthase [Xanthobacteraceae bacterium]
MAAAGISVLGAVKRDAHLAVPERHLGLVQALEHADLTERLARLADMAEHDLDLDGIVAAAAPLAFVRPTTATAATVPLPPPGQRIALAADRAFSFVYPHVVAGWRRAGAEIVAFSPLADEPPPADCDICWLPGGYPELYAGALAAARRFRDGLARFAVTRPVHGECGGYMVLGNGLADAKGERHEMAGLLGHETSFADRKLHLGYRAARLMAPGALGQVGGMLRGHEFHYASVTHAGNDAPFCELVDGKRQPLGPSGGRRGNVTGAFFHAIARE